MATNGLSTALTLYGARTLTLSQAGRRAGPSASAEFVEQLERRGIEVTDSERAAAAGTGTARPRRLIDGDTRWCGFLIVRRCRSLLFRHRFRSKRLAAERFFGIDSGST